MKRHFSRLSIFVVLLALLPVKAFAAQRLVPVGQVIGLQLYNDTVTVAAYDDVLGGAAKAAGLKIGDRIVKINDTSITCAEDVRAALDSADKELNLTVSRGGKQRELTLTPTQTGDGPRMGVYLRQGIAGIGTVTWYDPDTGAFGALGHGVCDSGGLLKMTRGSAYDASVTEVKKGKSGDPGQLKGTARSIEPAAAQHRPGRFRRDPSWLAGGGAAGGGVFPDSHRPGHHPGPDQRPCAGVFCGNFENLSTNPVRLPEFPAEGDRPGTAPGHRRHCAGNVRKPHFAGRAAHRRGDPRPCQRPHGGVWHLYSKYAGCGGVRRKIWIITTAFPSALAWPWP